MNGGNEKKPTVLLIPQTLSDEKIINLFSCKFKELKWKKPPASVSISNFPLPHTSNWKTPQLEPRLQVDLWELIHQTMCQELILWIKSMWTKFMHPWGHIKINFWLINKSSINYMLLGITGKDRTTKTSVRPPAMHDKYRIMLFIRQSNSFLECLWFSFDRENHCRTSLL